MSKTNDEPHPLEQVALSAFAKHPAQDRITLAAHLAGANFVTKGGSKAYLTVAEDVLGYMVDQGKIVRDPEGWFRLNLVEKE